MTHSAIAAAERLIRELRFHDERPRPERIAELIVQMRGELDQVEREVRACNWLAGEATSGE